MKLSVTEITDKILEKGVSEIIEKTHLENALKSGKKLRIKFGIDPTAPDLHLGHAVPLRKLRQFQDAGHKAVLIIGDFTAQIGDPSGRESARKPLSKAQIQKNLGKYLKLAGKIINIKKAEIRYNSDWLGKRTEIILELAASGSIQQVMHREDFKNRIAKGDDVTILETMYPLFQGYDSVAVNSDIEIGGIDQKLNLLSGRRVQRYFKKNEQDILMTPLLIGTDGEKKMSKSLGNYISLEEKPNEMFSKLMTIHDGEMINYFNLLTDFDFAIIEKETGKPVETKKRLAYEIVKFYHGLKKAENAKENFEKVFSKKEIPEDIKVYKINPGTQWVDFLTEQGFEASRSLAKRLIDGGGVEFNGLKITVAGEKITDSGILKIGKHKFAKLEILK